MLGVGAVLGLEFASGFMESLQKSNEASANAQYYAQQANLYRRNAQIARLNGSLNENISRSQQRMLIATSSAAAGEAGVGESPTTVSALATSMSVLEQNILYDRYRVESEAENYLYQAKMKDENARQMRKKSKNRYTNALLGGITSIF